MRLLIAILIVSTIVALALLAALLTVSISLPSPILQHSVERCVKVDLEYLYLKVRNVSRDVPLLGGKTLIEYVAVVRIENPYRNPIALDLVQVSLPESIEVDPQCRLVESSSPTYSSFVIKPRCSYGYANDLLLDSGHILFNERTRYTPPVLGVGKPFNVVHIAITGIVEVPSLWMHRLEKLDSPIYVLLVVEGHDKEHGAVDTAKVIKLVLERKGDGEYVFSSIPKGLGMHIRGTSVITEFYSVSSDES